MEAKKIGDAKQIIESKEYIAAVANAIKNELHPPNKSDYPADTEVEVYAILNAEGIADVPVGQSLYVNAGIIDENGEKKETYSAEYPSKLIPEGFVMRVNGQFTFSNQPIPRNVSLIKDSQIVEEKI